MCSLILLLINCKRWKLSTWILCFFPRTRRRKTLLHVLPNETSELKSTQRKNCRGLHPPRERRVQSILALLQCRFSQAQPEMFKRDSTRNCTRNTVPVLLIDVIEIFSSNFKRLSRRERANFTFSSFGSLRRVHACKRLYHRFSPRRHVIWRKIERARQRLWSLFSLRALCSSPTPAANHSNAGMEQSRRAFQFALKI